MTCLVTFHLSQDQAATVSGRTHPSISSVVRPTKTPKEVLLGRHFHFTVLNLRGELTSKESTVVGREFAEERRVYRTFLKETLQQTTVLQTIGGGRVLMKEGPPTDVAQRRRGRFKRTTDGCVRLVLRKSKRRLLHYSDVQETAHRLFKIGC